MAVARLLLGLVCLILLPFVVLVRTSTYLYSSNWPTHAALAVSATATALIIAGYAAWISQRLTGRLRLRVLLRRVALPLMVMWCSYSLLYLSSLNAKGSRVRSYYRTLHPILRVALSTVVLSDCGIVVTDLKRTPADYVSMGLPVKQESWHFLQEDGYVHAMDLRTVGRSKWRNWLVAGYFRTMGFKTLRHVGTADHLHVWLPSPAPPI
ncbi:MAG: hypothetical protein ACE5HT_12310 [Gemmatimonadales bacterium]